MSEKSESVQRAEVYASAIALSAMVVSVAAVFVALALAPVECSTAKKSGALRSMPWIAWAAAL